MKYFFAQMIVAMIDPIALLGYVVTALLSRHLWIAAALGVSWRIILSLALDLRISAGALIGAALMTALIYLARQLVARPKQMHIPKDNEDDFDPGDPPEWSDNPAPDALDEARSLAAGVIAFRYREIAASSGFGTAPTRKTSDARIVEIYKIVTSSFRRVAQERGERLSAKHSNYIAFYFMQIDESRGGEFFREHLKYELEKYKKEGLRATYRQEIELFPNDDSTQVVSNTNPIRPAVESKSETTASALGSRDSEKEGVQIARSSSGMGAGVGSDDSLYEDALTEFEGASRMKGRWARLYAESNGNESVAKAAYIRERVDEMRRAIRHQSESQI